MGIFTKNNHGIEYLYALAGKAQFFLGRKDETENLNLSNLKKATKITDQNFDKALEKYLEDVKEYSSYLPEPEQKEYLSKRTAELRGRLRRLEELQAEKDVAYVAIDQTLTNMGFLTKTAAASKLFTSDELKKIKQTQQILDDKTKVKSENE